METKNQKLIKLIKSCNVESFDINYEYQLYIDPETRETIKVLDHIRIEAIAKPTKKRHGN